MDLELRQLLRQLFTVVTLRRFLREHAPDVADEVGATDLAGAVDDSVAALRRHGRLNRAFFDALVQAFPGRQTEIEAVRDLILTPVAPPPPPQPPAILPADLLRDSEVCKELNARQRATLKAELGASRAFKRIFKLLDAFAKAGLTQRWLRQSAYKAPALARPRWATAPDQPRHRLVVVTRDDPPAVLAVIVYIAEHRRGRARVGPLVESAWICDIRRALDVSGEVFLLEAQHYIFLPWVSPGKLPVRGFPYRQQVPDEIVCVESCARMVHDFVRHHAGGPAIRDEDILRSGERPDLLPRKGMAHDQIVHVLSLGGRRAIRYSLEPGRPKELQLFIEVLHAYVDSQIPVVLVLERFRRVFDDDHEVSDVDGSGTPTYHAVVVVGHTAYAEPDAGQLRLFGFATATGFLREFIVYDDDIGPGLLLPVHGDGCRDFKLPDYLYAESVALSARSMYVSLPVEVQVPIEHVYEATRRFLQSDTWASERRKAQQPLEDIDEPDLQARVGRVRELIAAFDAATEDGQVVASVYLDSASRLRSNACSDPGLHLWDALAFVEQEMPEYVYVVELSTQALFAGDNPRVVGHLVFDSTVSLEELTSALILARTPGVLIVNPGEIKVGPSLSFETSHWARRNFRPAD